MSTVSYDAAAYAMDAAAPYLAPSRATCRVVWTDKVPIAAADKFWRIYLNPQRFPAFSVAEAGYIILHEVGHIVRDHSGRCAAIGADREGWNLSCDAELNSASYPGLRCPDCAVTPASLGMPAGKLAEEYYATKKQEEDEGEDGESGDGSDQASGSGSPGDQGDGQGGAGKAAAGVPGQSAGEEEADGQGRGRADGPGHGAGSASDGQSRPWELPADDPSSPGLQGAEQTAARLAAAAAIREYAASQGRGTMPGGWGLWAESTLSPVVPWQSKLRPAITSGLSRIGLGAQSYSRVRERNGVCLPRHVRRVPVVAVVADTSGSMGSGEGTPWHRALSEVVAIARTVGSVHIVWCDAAASVQRDVRSLREVRPVGGGGTDMRVGITAADALRPDVIVTLTDGETPWPDAAPRAKHIAVVIGRRAGPGWGEMVRVNR